MTVAFVYEDASSQYVLRADHVFRPSRLHRTFELLAAYEAFAHPESRLVVPELADEEELLWLHTSDYVAAVKSLSHGETTVNPLLYNFNELGDNPVYPGMYESAALAVGGSLMAGRLVASGEAEAAFHIAGGLHHAARDHASGFCIFNDAAIAILDLVRRGFKVAYVDIDAHHGDGVQDAFFDTDRVLTISLHESGRYLFPGTGDVGEMGAGAGEGFAVNVPLAPNTDDEIYAWAFDRIVPPLLESFRPDVLVSQLGTDTHFRDPLAHLALTVQGFGEIVARIKRLAPRWVALGGGGYDMSAVARCWTLAYGVMLGLEWPDELPGPYARQYGETRLRDVDPPRLTAAARATARRFAEATVDDVRRKVFPRHGL